ncbi:MAG TPA: hypothetical protein VL282_11145 [Tepidisphaeraceae bacterium]|nr:hypothetical protein [Tepidisphaeraceae bacterium]
MNYRRWLMMLFMSLATATFAAESVTLVKPIYTEIYLRSAQAQKIAGQLLRYDDETLVVKTSSGERELHWLDLTGTSAYALRARLIDKTKPEDWMAVGRLAWSLGASEQAQRAFDSAIKLDSSLRAKVKEIQATPAGSVLRSAATSATTRAVNSGSSSPDAGAVVNFQKSTPQQDADAILRAQNFAKGVADEMKLHFTELQTTHFIIFTDWDPQEFEFLKINVEEACAAVSRQFNIPVKENIFVGKLPVFMFSVADDFKKFAQTYDELNADQLRGYYHSRSDGTGHMAMWKPDIIKNDGNVKKAEEEWAYVLTHEFTHAFVNRYRSNARVARWLNEGLAEVIAQSSFPNPNTKPLARRYAIANDAILSPIFDDDEMPAGQFYPVMQTMVQMLIDRDVRRFIKMFNAIKDGEKTEQALKEVYGIDYAGLTKAWREYVQRH